MTLGNKIKEHTLTFYLCRHHSRLSRRLTCDIEFLTKPCRRKCRNTKLNSMTSIRNRAGVYSFWFVLCFWQDTDYMSVFFITFPFSLYPHTLRRGSSHCTFYIHLLWLGLSVKYSYLACVVTAENLRLFLFKFHSGPGEQGQLQLARNLWVDCQRRANKSSEKTSDIATKAQIEVTFTAWGTMYSRCQQCTDHVKHWQSPWGYTINNQVEKKLFLRWTHIFPGLLCLKYCRKITSPTAVIIPANN